MDSPFLTHWAPLVGVRRCLSRAGGNQDLFQCNETKSAGNETVFRLHEAMVKPPAIRKRPLENDGPRGAAMGRETKPCQRFAKLF